MGLYTSPFPFWGTCNYWRCLIRPCVAACVTEQQSRPIVMTFVLRHANLFKFINATMYQRVPTVIWFELAGFTLLVWWPLFKSCQQWAVGIWVCIYTWLYQSIKVEYSSSDPALLAKFKCHPTIPCDIPGWHDINALWHHISDDLLPKNWSSKTLPVSVLYFKMHLVNITSTMNFHRASGQIQSPLWDDNQWLLEASLPGCSEEYRYGSDITWRNQLLLHIAEGAEGASWAA